MQYDNTTNMLSAGKPMISIIIPAYNESIGIRNTIREVHNVMADAGIAYEIIVVDDGSSDNTFKTLQGLSQKFETLKAIHFSRNFGKEAALLAGLKASTGDAVITMDSDLQHPPATIPQLIEKWQQGYKVVHAVKSKRLCDSRFVKWRASLFNWIFEKLGGISLKNSSDFILLDCEAKDIMIHCLSERMRFYRGLAHWIGFRQAIVYFNVAERWDKTNGRFSITSLFNLATTAMVSFTSAPLRIITFLGMLTLALGLVIGAEALISWIMGRSISGFVTTIGTLLIIGSFIMISLGIIGEYVAKIYEEIKGRPHYIVESSFGFQYIGESQDKESGKIPNQFSDRKWWRLLNKKKRKKGKMHNIRSMLGVSEKSNNMKSILGVSEKNNLIVCVVLILLINWAANFSLFNQFGLYVDDYYRIPRMMESAGGNFHEQLRMIFTGDLNYRPLHYWLINGLSLVGYYLGDLPGIYLVGYIISTLNALLCFIILRRILNDPFFALAGAIFFCLYPIVTTKIWITSLLGIQPAMTFLLFAFLFYIYDRRVLSFAMIIPTLFLYESFFPIFLTAPFLKMNLNRNFIKEFSKHVLILSVLFICFVALKISFSDPRVAELDFYSAVYASLKNMVAGPIVNLKKNISIPIKLLLHFPAHLILFLLVIFAGLCSIMIFLSRSIVGNQIKAGHTTFENNRIQTDSGAYKRLTTALVAGVLMLMLGYPMTFWAEVRHFNGIASRIHSAAQIGLTLLIAALLAYLVYLFNGFRKKNIAVALMAAVFSLLTIYDIEIQKEYCNSWDYQRKFFTSVLEKCPDLEENTLILIDNKGPQKYPAMPPINWSVSYVLDKLYYFPVTWSYSPRLYLVKSKDDGDLIVGSIIKAKSGKDLSDLLDNFDPSDADRPVEPGNIIFLTLDQGKIERQSQLCVSGGDCYELKKRAAGISPEFDKGVLYNYLIEKRLNSISS